MLVLVSCQSFWAVPALVLTREDACVLINGPWKNPEILRMVQNGDHKCAKKCMALAIDEKTIPEDETASSKENDSFKVVSPKFARDHMEHPQVSPVLVEKAP